MEIKKSKLRLYYGCKALNYDRRQKLYKIHVWLDQINDEECLLEKFGHIEYFKFWIHLFFHYKRCKNMKHGQCTMFRELPYYIFLCKFVKIRSFRYEQIYVIVLLNTPIDSMIHACRLLTANKMFLRTKRY